VADIYRWERDGGKPASVAKAKDEVVQIRIELARLHTSHVSKELVPRISSFRSSFRNHKKITTFVWRQNLRTLRILRNHGLVLKRHCYPWVGDTMQKLSSASCQLF
jgi:hypothetical protein